MDEKLAESSLSANPINEFSFYFFIGQGSQKSSRSTSPLCIHEEYGAISHYNVYLQNDRWDILPVEINEVVSSLG